MRALVMRAVVGTGAVASWCVMSACVASSGIAAPARPAPPDPSRPFGDWLAACDNLGDCAAYGFGADDTAATLVLGLPLMGPITATMIMQPDRSSHPSALRLQPPRHAATVTVRLVADDGGTMRGSLSPGEVAPLLSALRGGGRMTLLLPRAGARPVMFGGIHLAGAAGALAWIEQRQHRPPEPPPSPSPSPPPPSPPPFEAATPNLHSVPAAVATLPTVRACARQDADDPATDIAAWRLSPTVTLWQLPCGSGNFDRASLFVLADTRLGRAAPAGFASLPQVAPRAPGVLVNAQTGPDGQTITATEPSRGLNDCGDVRSYRWDGVRFSLTLARLMTACRGVAPQDWPVVYRGRQVGPGAGQQSRE